MSSAAIGRRVAPADRPSRRTTTRPGGFRAAKACPRRYRTAPPPAISNPPRSTRPGASSISPTPAAATPKAATAPPERALPGALLSRESEKARHHGHSSQEQSASVPSHRPGAAAHACPTDGGTPSSRIHQGRPRWPLTRSARWLTRYTVPARACHVHGEAAPNARTERRPASRRGRRRSAHLRGVSIWCVLSAGCPTSASTRLQSSD